jgi:hypothetical protein
MFAGLLVMLSLYWHFIAAYIGGGAGYAILKWILSILKLRGKVLEINAQDIPEDSTGVGDAYNNKKYLREGEAKKIFNTRSYPPLASENKSKLFGWAALWPINLVYTLFADVAREAWNFLYEKCGALLDKISKAILPN